MIVDDILATFHVTCCTDEKDGFTSDPIIPDRRVVRVPRLAYGTYLIPSTAEGEAAVTAALARYRHLDCAPVYGNEITIGRSILLSGVSRGTLFLTSKVWNTAQRSGRAAVRDSVLQSICDLHGVGREDVLSRSSPPRYYLDLVLVHWPVVGHHTETYRELEALYREGLVRAVGLSNYTVEDYEELLASGIRVTPALNQMEVSPLMYRRNTIEYFQEKGVVVAASKPLRRGGVQESEVVAGLARKYGRSPAQVCLRWCLQKELVVACKSSRPSRMEENVDVFDFVISAEDVETLDGLTTEEDVRKREERERDTKDAL